MTDTSDIVEWGIAIYPRPERSEPNEIWRSLAEAAVRLKNVGGTATTIVGQGRREYGVYITDPNDEETMVRVSRHDIDLDELGMWLRFACRFKPPAGWNP